MIRRAGNRDILKSLPKERVAKLREYYTNQRQISFIASVLSEPMLQAIDDIRGLFAEDYLYIAMAKKVIRDKPQIAQMINDKYMYASTEHLWEESNWSEHQKRALAVKLGHVPDGHELAQDAEKHQMGLLFKMYFFYKHRDAMRLKD